LNFRVFKSFQNVISKGVSEPRVFISGRAALRDLVFTCQTKGPSPLFGRWRRRALIDGSSGWRPLW